MSSLLFRVEDAWNENTLRNVLEAASEVGIKDLGLDIYQNEVVIVNEEGMQDAYNSHGLPHMYPHWSFGKQARQLEKKVKEGQGLAYELVIPTDPCKSWNMASNSSATMALVLAHAAVGHNHFFKNNYLFRKHTDAAGLNQYLMTVRDAVMDFEKRYGMDEVEEIIDAVHALAMPCGMFRHGQPKPFDAEREAQKIADYMRALEQSIDPETIESVPGIKERLGATIPLPERHISFPEGNVLYFIEKYAPNLLSWQRQLIRMIRNIGQQVWLPMLQTKFMNEGFATFTHMYILRKLYEAGRLDDATWLEIVHLNQGVTFQSSMRHHGFLAATHNPYAMGSALLRDIVRIAGPRGDDVKFFRDEIDCSGPMTEDRKYFPSFAGSGDWRGVIKDAVRNYNDASAIEQFMSPKYVRDYGLFLISDQDDHYLVEAVQTREDFEEVRKAFATAHSIEQTLPDVRVVDANLEDDRTLFLEYYPVNGMLLRDGERKAVLSHTENLWGFEVSFEAVEPQESSDG